MPRGSTYTPEVYRANTVDRTAKINTENTYAILNRLQGEVDYLKRISSLALLIDGSNQMLANLHLNGFNLDLDVDRDTYLGTDGDDHVELVMNGPSGQFDITINGADDFTFTANSFNVLAGSSINVAPAAFITFGDGDSYIYEPADDNIEIVLAGAGGEFSININGAEDFNFTANSLHVLSGSHIQMADDTWIGLGAELDPGIGKLYFDSSPATHEMRLVLMNLDLNNNDVVFDTDGDTYIHATADDVVTLVMATAAGGFKININGAEDFNFTANTLNVLVGSHVEMGDDTWIGFTAGGQLVWDSTPADNEIRVVGASLDMNGNTIIFDGDGDTFLEVIGDDDLALTFPVDGTLEIAFNDVDFTFTANSFNVLAGSHIEMADDTWIGATGGVRIEFDTTPAVDSMNMRSCNVILDTGYVDAKTYYYINNNKLISIDGTANVLFGVLCGVGNTGSFNVFMGNNCGGQGGAGTSGSYNVGVGYQAENKLTTGAQNFGCGYQSLYNLTIGEYNVAMGSFSSLSAVDATGCTAIGAGALYRNVSGIRLIGIGWEAGYNACGSYGVWIGYRTGYGGGVNNTGTGQTVVGYAAGYSATTGGGNAYCGRLAGYYITTGTNNTQIGNEAGYNASQKVDATNSTAIGYQAYNTLSNQFVFGNGSIVETWFTGDNNILKLGAGKDTGLLFDGTHFYIRNLIANANTEFIFDNFTTQDMDCIVNIKAGESKDAILQLTADEADDNADNARIVHYAATNAVSWEDYSSGAWVAYLTKKSGGIINMSNVPVYANNAAAVAGGLVAGDLYRTNGDPDPVCIVH